MILTVITAQFMPLFIFIVKTTVPLMCHCLCENQKAAAFLKFLS